MVYKTFFLSRTDKHEQRMNFKFNYANLYVERGIVSYNNSPN